ncbi:flagellar biosynthesis anti-sigma factor FlgM [Pseudohongiella spirulinae]|uniref:Negative regulator of flagellin synthesis n=1 Tax=Pseudohongiella spirulinae TaxID=1249552 RepID=A0A0S2KEA7_9GAMM|nr:flagellar biosynthesis anti-sigma factor FlgM [Pseudohongiella spirulinae]ALO46662.1 Flagellar biosynthesis anti-sigma factor protein FlgM [Pseudohongiella spirulinae]
MSISSIGNPTSPTDSRSPVKQPGSQPASGSGTGSGKTDAHGGSGALAPVDAVSISSQASDLQALETRIKALPDTDVARVSQIKDKISTGDYQIDSQRVADKILAFEKELK